MTNKSYRRNDLKNKAYGCIAKEMGMMVEVVKRKIWNLRTTSTNEKRKINARKSGSGGKEQYIYHCRGTTKCASWITRYSFEKQWTIQLRYVIGWLLFCGTEHIWSRSGDIEYNIGSYS